jgi:hypothetical protein
VLQINLLPPEAPTVRLWFRYDINSPFKYHRDCLGVGPWESQTERSYKSTEEMIEELITHKDNFWYHHFEKGLFFSNSYPIITGEEEVEE